MYSFPTIREIHQRDGPADQSDRHHRRQRRLLRRRRHRISCRCRLAAGHYAEGRRWPPTMSSTIAGRRTSIGGTTPRLSRSATWDTIILRRSWSSGTTRPNWTGPPSRKNWWCPAATYRKVACEPHVLCMIILLICKFNNSKKKKKKSNKKKYRKHKN